MSSGQCLLAVTTWILKQCERLMSPFLNAILPKWGLNCHTPHVVIHGSKLYGGFQIAHFFVEQGYLSIKFLLGHIRESSLTGRHLMVLLSQVQLVSRCTTPYLEDIGTLQDYVPHLWLGGIRRYLGYAKGCAIIPNAWKSSLQQGYDVMLMDCFKATKLDNATLDHLNRIRLFLGATTLADICNDDKKRILCWALTGYTQARPVFPWPNQAKPSKYSWQIWQRYICTLFVTKIQNNSRTDKDWSLDDNLGLWTTQHLLLHRDAYFVEDKNKVYVKNMHGCYVCHKHTPRSISMYELMTVQLPSPPSNAVFTPTKKLPDPHIQCILGDLADQDIDADYWATMANDGKVSVTSDGSVRDVTGTYAVIFKTRDKEIRFQGLVDCHTSLIQLYCTELTGILTIYYLIQCIKKYSNIKITETLTSHVDNISVVAMNNQDGTYLGIAAHTCSDIDILQEIWSLKVEGLQVNAGWVEAHQDTKYPQSELLAEASLNCTVDADAAKYRTQ
eukprot:15337007-Ditylum_brightwellii.AAC.1